VAIDRHSRLPYGEVLAHETAGTTAGPLHRAVAWDAAHGITAERLLSDNVGAFRSHHVARVAIALRLSQRLTQAYRPHTNGQGDHSIRTPITA
jgi:transposase InsO family protein